MTSFGSDARRPVGDLLVLFLQHRLGGDQTSDRDAERRAAHVVHADVVEEHDRVRVAAMLTADTDLELARGAAWPPRIRPTPCMRLRWSSAASLPPVRDPQLDQASLTPDQESFAT